MKPTQPVVREILIAAQLEEILRAFAAGGIEVCVLKGLALWGRAYAPGERPVCDIDLLVRDRAMRRAGGLIEGLGYRRVPQNRMRPATEREYYNEHYERHDETTGVEVELHRSPIHRTMYRFDLDGIFDRAIPLGAAGAGALQLSPEDSLLELAVHRGIHHFIGYEKNVVDVDRIVVVHAIDWDALVTRARRWGCATALWILLDAARGRQGTPIPATVDRALAPRGWRRCYLEWLLERREGGWTLRRREMGSWPRRAVRLLVHPLILDRPSQHLRFMGSYAWLRLRDLGEFIVLR